MERIKELNRYQKGILLLLAVMVVFFGVIYGIVTSRVGFLYKDVILLPTEENGSTIYSGKISGQDCRFTVTADKTVTFRCDETVYGPYTAKEDPSAIPEGDEPSDRLHGIEVKKGDEIIFRGSVYQADTFWMLTNEDGSYAGFNITATAHNGITFDANGNVVDPMEPDASDIWSLINGPELTKKGHWLAWFMGILLSALTAVSILFADELFRWNLAFQIRNVENAEPSDWEIASRYIGWGVLTITILILYIAGLRAY